MRTMRSQQSTRLPVLRVESATFSAEARCEPMRRWLLLRAPAGQTRRLLEVQRVGQPGAVATTAAPTPNGPLETDRCLGGFGTQAILREYSRPRDSDRAAEPTARHRSQFDYRCRTHDLIAARLAKPPN